MAETNAQRKKRRIIPNTLADVDQPAAVTGQASFETQPSTTGELARTTAGGLRQIEALGQQALGAGAAIVGADEFAEERIAAGQQAQQEAAKFAPRIGRVEDITNFEDATDFVKGVIGQQGPILGVTALGGLAGVGARALAPAAVAARVSAPIAATAGAVGAAGGIETGAIFGEAVADPQIRKDFSLREIAGASVAGAVPAAALEALPVLSVLKKFGVGTLGKRSIRKSLLEEITKGTISQAALESGTEAAQTVIERATIKFLNENREIFDEEGRSEILNAAVAGGIIGGGLGGLGGGFSGIQAGSVDDQLEIEDSLDELETTGGASSDLDLDLDALGVVGNDIRSARFLQTETQITNEPEKVIERILANTVGGNLPTSRSFAQLVEAVGNLENPAQLPNLLAASGIDPEIRDQLADALQQKADGNQEDHISLAVDERPISKLEETGPDEFGGPGGFQSPNVTRSHILRNRKGKLGFIASNNPQQENALRSTLTRLEGDFPDINFDVVGLGDAIFAGLSPVAKETEAKANQAMRSIAEEKLNEPGFSASKFAPLDPNDPKAFLNQFKAIKKEEVNVALSGRDEFRLTDSDLGGATRKTEVQVGGPVTKLDPKTKKPISTQRAKTTVAQPTGRPIFVTRKVAEDGDFNVTNKGEDQTIDAIALTNRMLSKREGDNRTSVQEVADAFFTGITALQQRGVEISFIEGGLPDDLIIHKKPGKNGRTLTWGQVKVKGSMRIRARIAAFKEHEAVILAKIKEINKNMQSSKIGEAGKKSMQRQVKKLQRRVDKIPTSIETLNIFGKSVSRDVQDLTRRLNDASELEIALKNEAEGLSDIAVEIQEIRRQLDSEGFQTQSAEELSKIGTQLEDLDNFATQESRERRGRTAAEGSLESPEGEVLTLDEFSQAKLANQQELIAEAQKETKPLKDSDRSKIRFSAGELDFNLPLAREVVEKFRKKNITSALFARDGVGLSDVRNISSEALRESRLIDIEVDAIFRNNPELEVTYDDNGDPVVLSGAEESRLKLQKLLRRQDALGEGKLGPSNVDEATQVFIEREAARMTGALNLNRVRVLTGDVAADFLRVNKFLQSNMKDFMSGDLGGFALRRVRTAEAARDVIERSGILDSIPPSKRETSMANAIKQVLADQENTFKSLGPDVDHVIIVNPFLTNRALIAEILAHEIGHVTFQTHYANASEEVKGQIRDDFDRWREELGRLGNLTVPQAFTSKRSFEFAMSGFGYSQADANLRIGELTTGSFEYVMDFEEWFADQTSRWFNPPPTQLEQMSAADEFFKNIADDIRALWDKFVGLFGFEPAPSVNDFLNDIVHKNVEAELGAAHNSVSLSAAKVGLDSDNMGVAAVFQTMDPFGPGANFSIREVMRDNLEPAERATVFKHFNRRSVKNKLKKLLDDPKQQQMIEGSPLQAAAFGYQMWIAGTFKLETASQEQVNSAGEFTDATAPVTTGVARLVGSIFQGLFDALAGRLGFVYESEEVEQILVAVRDGTISARKAGTNTFSVISAVRGDILQRVAQSSNDAFEHIKPFFDKAIGVADSRMLDSGIPAFIDIAQSFHARTGSEGQATTYFEARQAEIGKFMNSYTRITTDLQKNPELKADVLRLLRNPGAKGDPEAIKRASAIRKLLRRIRNYVEASGVQIGDRGKDYFPWVFDSRKMQDNSDFMRSLLADERFDANMQGIMDNLNERIASKNEKILESFNKEHARLLKIPVEKRSEQVKRDLRKKPSVRRVVTKEDLIDEMMIGLEQNEGLADTNLNPAVAGTTPYFAAMNKRTLGFLTKPNGLTEAERARFDGLFSDQLDLTMMTYIRQAVKRTEYSRRFNPDSSVLTRQLEEAVEEGATAKEMAMAYSYIDAMTGVIGEGTNNRIAKVLGLSTRQGEVINPHWRTFTSIAMVLQNLAVLPLATFTSLVDPVGIMVRSQDLNATMAALRVGAKEIVNEVKLLVGGDDTKARSELRKLAEGMGTIEDHMTNEALEWEYGSTYLTPRLKATNEWFFKAIGLSQWTRVTRLMALAGGKEFLKRHVQRPNQNSERFLKQLNIAAEDIKFDGDGDIKMLSRLEREGENADPDELARDDRVRLALNRFVDESILRPNAAQRPIWASDPNYALVFHLKSFMFSFHDRILRRAGQEAELGNMLPLMLLAAFIPAMLMADILRDLVQFGLDGNPRKAKWGLADHMWNASQRSGLNGIGQLLIDAKDDIQFGGLGYESLAGPTVDGITDLGGLFSSDDEAQWNAFTRNLPGSSAWKHWLENGLDES
jgi:hypothetical protein